ncbi:MAG: hypothetical protein H6716_28290 [Polyangiaceae bacterium]|nr:hypothetical protein [Polyangiaceae bacterium]
MAQDLTLFKTVLEQTLISKVGDYRTEMLKLCTPIIDPRSSAKVTDFDGAGNFTTKTGPGAPTAQAVRAMGSASSPATKEQLIVLTDDDLLDQAAAAALTASRIIEYAWNEVVADYFGLLFSGRTTAHPENGVSGSPLAATGGGTVYFVDAFDVTTISSGANFSQTNDHSLALSATNLSTVLAKRRTYKTREGKKLKDASIRPYLVVPPELETLATDLASQAGRFYTGSGVDSGFAGRLAGVIVAPGDSVSVADAWAVVYVGEKMDSIGRMARQGPVNSHIRMLPQVRVGQPTDANDVHVLSEFAFDNFYSNDEGDLLFSKP